MQYGVKEEETTFNPERVELSTEVDGLHIRCDATA